MSREDGAGDGVRPATSSLGIQTYVGSKSLARFCGEFLNLQRLAESAFSEFSAQTRRKRDIALNTIWEVPRHRFPRGGYSALTIRLRRGRGIAGTRSLFFTCSLQDDPGALNRPEGTLCSDRPFYGAVGSG